MPALLLEIFCAMAMASTSAGASTSGAEASGPTLLEQSKVLFSCKMHLVRIPCAHHHTAVNYDEATMAQVERIQKEVASG